MADCKFASFRNSFAGKHILVTGGAGFIGSHLAANLLSLDAFVTVLDNFSTGKRENIAPFMENKNFRLIEGDIRNMEDCKKALANVDMVLHEAALGSVPRSIKDPVTSTHVNILGFVNMLSSCVEAGIKRIVYAASSSTYGDSKTLPKVEENIRKGPYFSTLSGKTHLAFFFFRLNVKETYHFVSLYPIFFAFVGNNLRNKTHFARICGGHSRNLDYFLLKKAV